MILAKPYTLLCQTTDIKEGTIKIGLLVQDKNYLSAADGADLAIKMANDQGGLKGQKFQLAVRSMEGPWGTGSKQAVELIFEEKVWGLVGCHNGRNAHLVEQAATKSTVVFISAWSADPTLSQAFVPWFFNCVPNDLQQSRSLTNEIYGKRNLKKTAVIYGGDYDSKMSFNNFSRAVASEDGIDLIPFNYDSYEGRLEELNETLYEKNPECVILLCKPSAALQTYRMIRRKGSAIPIFGSLNILNENELPDSGLKEFDNDLIIPSHEWPTPGNTVFREKYRKIYGRDPGMSASYAFDATCVLIEAIRKAGVPDREKIQKAIKNISYKGITGLIKFDDKGNRSGDLLLMNTRGGIPE